MPVFRYRAADSVGKVESGMVFCADVASLQAQLAENQKHLIRARPYHPPPHWLCQRAIARGLCAAFGHWSRLLHQRARFIDAIKIVAPLSGLRILEAAFCQLEAELRGGASIAQAMQLQPKIFPAFVVQCMQQAESGGNLEQACAIVHDFLAQQIAIHDRLHKALFYPMCVLASVCVLLLLALRFLVPLLRPLLEDFGADAAGQQMVFTLSDLVVRVSFAHALLAALIAGIVWEVRRHWTRKSGAQRQVQTTYAWILWLHMLALALKSGVPLKKAVRLPAPPGLAAEAKTLADAVTKGAALDQAFAQTPAFPNSATAFARMGEEAGNLGEMLAECALFEQKLLADHADRWLRYLPPVLLLLAGTLLLWVLFAIVFPLYAGFE